jgi:hypothetical protein
VLGERASPLAENLARDAGVCQGRQRVGFALKDLTAAEEASIVALVKKAVS